MRIAYLLHWIIGFESGGFKKVMSQARFWQAHGCEVKIFLLCRGEHNENDRMKHLDISIEAVSYGKSLIDRFSKMKCLAVQVMKWQPDLVYTRYDLYYPALTALAGAIPTVLEVNTDDTTEYLLRPFYVYCYNCLTRGRLLAAADGTVFVSRELSEKPYFASYSKKATVISNGIDLSRYPVMPPVSNPAPRLIFIGTPHQPWQGVDKIIWLAWHLPEWTFDLIGFSMSDVKAAIPSNVTLHGFMDRAGYEKIIARADVAIGTMALHRKQMEEASPLKVREYLAYGIPTIIGYKDTDFPDANPYILKLPNNPDNVRNNVEAIKNFVESSRGTRVPREMVRHIDTKYKEEARLMFMRSIAEEGKKM